MLRLVLLLLAVSEVPHGQSAECWNDRHLDVGGQQELGQHPAAESGERHLRQEEKLLVSLDHETREMHRTDVVLRSREIGHQRGQLLGERLGVGGTLDREVNDEMILLTELSSSLMKDR